MTENNTAAEQLKNTPGKQIRSDWKSLAERISYKGIVANIPYIAFIGILCIVYISYNQRSLQTQRTLNQKNAELKELRWKYMDVKSRLISAQKESEVLAKGAALGLQPMTYPPYAIKVQEKH